MEILQRINPYRLYDQPRALEIFGPSLLEYAAVEPTWPEFNGNQNGNATQNLTGAQILNLALRAKKIDRDDLHERLKWLDGVRLAPLIGISFSSLESQMELFQFGLTTDYGLPLANVHKLLQAQKEVPAPITEREQWLHYALYPNPEFETFIITDLEGLVRHTVKHTSSQGMPYEDAFACAQTGILESMRRYDPTLGAKFSTYAIGRMRGAIKDESRRFDVLSRPDRTILSNYQRALNQLAISSGHIPSYQEVATAIDIDVGELQKIIEIGQTSSSIEEMAENNNLSPDKRLELEDHSIGPEQSVLLSELQEAISKYAGMLHPEEVMIIDMHYLRGLTIKEVGLALGQSESRISQKNKDATDKLRLILTEKGYSPDD